MGDIKVGGGGDQPPPIDLTIQDQGVSQEVEQLGVNAQSLLDTEGTLTDADMALLKEAANILIGKPNLPEPDRKALNSWLAKLTEVKTRDSTQHSEADLFDPKLISDLLSNDPEVVAEALSTLTSSESDPRVTPEEKEALKELAKTISSLGGKEAEAFKKALESNDPAEIAKALKDLLAQSDIDLSDEAKGKLEELLTGAATTISILNIASGFENDLTVLTSSTSAESIYQSLWGCIDVSTIPPGSRDIVLAKLEGLAVEIAQANTPPEAGITAFHSMTPGAIADKLKHLMNYYQMAEGPDKAAISTVINSISTSIASANALSQGGFETLFLQSIPESNPYMQPGIMANLAIVMSELSKVYMEIMKQSSQLKIGMMGLVASMAKEAYNAAMSAGMAKVEQLKVEVKEAQAQILMAALMIGATVAMTVAQAGFTHGKMKQYDTSNKDNTMKQMHRAEHGEDVKMPTDKTSKEYQSLEKAYMHSERRVSYEGQQQRLTTTWTALNQQFSTIGQNLIKAVFTTQKESLVMEESAQNALKEMINQLLQTVMDTMRTAGEETQRASKDWQAFNQLFKDMASTITNAIFRS